MFPHTAHVESMAVFEWDPDWKPRAVPVEIVEPTSVDRGFDDADGAEPPSLDDAI
jgi:hypothetical protein